MEMVQICIQILNIKSQIGSCTVEGVQLRLFKLSQFYSTAYLIKQYREVEQI